METPSSDLDVFEAYIAPTRDFLIGKTHSGSYHSKTEEGDLQTSEIGTVITQLKKNNVNYLINVFSPKIICGDIILKELQEITFKNLSKSANGSIGGFAYSAFKDYENKREKQEDKALKQLRIAGRIYQFGITLFKKGIIEFAPSYITTTEEYNELESKYDGAYYKSKLPDIPEHLELFDDWLYKLRVEIQHDKI